MVLLPHSQKERADPVFPEPRAVLSGLHVLCVPAGSGPQRASGAHTAGSSYLRVISDPLRLVQSQEESRLPQKSSKQSQISRQQPNGVPEQKRARPDPGLPRRRGIGPAQQPHAQGGPAGLYQEAGWKPHQGEGGLVRQVPAGATSPGGALPDLRHLREENGSSLCLVCGKGLEACKV